MLRTWFVPVAGLALLLMAGCATTPEPTSAPQAAAVADAPPAPGILPQDLVGRWGLASYHKESDRVRTTAQARAQCNQPYVVTGGPEGGAMMHLADAPTPTEVWTKGSTDGRRYVGPRGPAGDGNDREILSFDGRVLVLRWVDKEVGGRYGTMVYVRCGAVAGPTSARRRGQ
jgi:hypothetical protein